MTQDLFTNKSKKEMLLDYIKSIYYARTSQIIAFGSRNFDNRADRNKRLLVEEGKIRKISDEEKNFRFAKTAEDIYEYVGG